MNVMNRLFRKMKLRSKMLIAPLAVIIFLLSMAALSYWALAAQRAVILEIFEEHFAGYRSGARILQDTLGVHTNTYKIIGWVEAGYDEERISLLSAEQTSTLASLIETMNLQRERETDNSEKKLLCESILAKLTTYQKAVSGVLDIVTSDHLIATMYMGVADDEFQALDRELRDLLDLENRLAEEKRILSISQLGTFIALLFALILACISLSLVVSFLIARWIAVPLDKAIMSLLETSDQLKSVSTQVSSSSQSLAEGASEQAAAIEETSSSFEEMSSMTKQNADNARQANALMAEAKEVVMKANESMSQLIRSMSEISLASEETSKIVKTIDEIAFQTNLLALNAAVEAARAGEAGAGFAVVADEVRNLSLRAAEAAKNTAKLIEGTVKKVGEGTAIAGSTSKAFEQVGTSSVKVAGLVDEIAGASAEQAQGFEQVNKAVTEMDKVIQQNAANAEESASASEELNAQAE